MSVRLNVTKNYISSALFSLMWPHNHFPLAPYNALSAIEGGAYRRWAHSKVCRRTRGDRLAECPIVWFASEHWPQETFCPVVFGPMPLQSLATLLSMCIHWMRRRVGSSKRRKNGTKKEVGLTGWYKFHVFNQTKKILACLGEAIQVFGIVCTDKFRM